MKRTFSSIVVLLSVLVGAPAYADAPIPIKEWPVPWANTGPRDPFAASGNEIWFVGQRGHYVAALNPDKGTFRRIELENGAGPHNAIVAPDGTVWYSGNRAAHIGKVDPKTGAIKKIPMPDPAAVDPHTLVFDSKGDIWFTVQGGNMVGKLTVANDSVRLVKMQTANSRPYGIVMDSKDRPWIVLFGTNKLATVDPKTFAATEIDIPRPGARPRRIGITSDDALWYVDYAEGYLGRYDPTTRKFEEWLNPGGAQSRPYAMAVDDKNNIWLVETGSQPNKFVGFDPTKKDFFSLTEIASGGGAVRHMHFHKPTRTIWFGTDTHTIGAAKVP